MSLTEDMQQTDCREEILAASRQRSGSMLLDKIPDLSPKSPEQNHDDSSRNYGSKVSRLKSMFQGGTTDSPLSPQGGVKPVQSGSPYYIASKYSRSHSVSAFRDRTQIVKPPLPPKSPILYSSDYRDITRNKSPVVKVDSTKYREATSHVERFNYTRALFARMEQDNKDKYVRESRFKSRYERFSSGAPVSSLPTSPTRRHRSASSDSIIKSSSYDAIGDSSSVTLDNTFHSRGPACDYSSEPNIRKSPVVFNEHDHLEHSYPPNFPKTPSGLLYKRRLNTDKLIDAEITQGTHSSLPENDSSYHTYSDYEDGTLVHADIVMTNGLPDTISDESPVDESDGIVLLRHNKIHPLLENNPSDQNTLDDDVTLSTEKLTNDVEHQDNELNEVTYNESITVTVTSHDTPDEIEEVPTRRRTGSPLARRHAVYIERNSADNKDQVVEKHDHNDNLQSLPSIEPERENHLHKYNQTQSTQQPTSTFPPTTTETVLSTTTQAPPSTMIPPSTTTQIPTSPTTINNIIYDVPKRLMADYNNTPEPEKPQFPMATLDDDTLPFEPSPVIAVIGLGPGVSPGVSPEPQTTEFHNTSISEISSISSFSSSPSGSPLKSPPYPPKPTNLSHNSIITSPVAISRNKRPAPAPPLPDKPSHLTNGGSYDQIFPESPPDIPAREPVIPPREPTIPHHEPVISQEPSQPQAITLTSLPRHDVRSAWCEDNTPRNDTRWEDDNTKNTKMVFNSMFSEGELSDEEFMVDGEDLQDDTEEARVVLVQEGELSDLEDDDLLVSREDPEDIATEENQNEDALSDMTDPDFGEYDEIQGLPDTDDEFEPSVPVYQRDVKVKFSKQPIRVYTTYSTGDYDRRNEDIDPVAASAEYELEKRVEKMDVFPVDLHKGAEGLGLSIIGMGVGADAGLEKLGIFIKTLTPAGAAQRDGRIQVNDQIIEVDGKRLVGVTQAYAASVLRNTTGQVYFQIGREKNPENSEVARLIQQSLEQDRLREEIRVKEQERIHQLQESIRIQEEQECLRLQEAQERLSDPEPDISDHDTQAHLHESDEEEFEDESAAGEATPMSLPTDDVGDGTSSGDDEPTHTQKPETFDLIGSSSDSPSPDMDAQDLFIKLKESQYKNAVAEAEIAKLKAKIIYYEGVDSQKKDAERKTEVMAQRLLDMEKSLDSARKEINSYQDLLEDSQGQYIALEKRLQSEHANVDKKYHKAKKLIKEYQIHEKDMIDEREAIVEQHRERELQYNGLVKTLKDRIISLEKDLSESQKAAGLPPLSPKESPKVEPLSNIITENGLVKIKEYQRASDESDISELAASPDVDISLEEERILDNVPDTELLDNSAGKTKALLASVGGIATRRPPKQWSSQGSPDSDADNSFEKDVHSDTWIGHDSGNTVKKNGGRIPRHDMRVKFRQPEYIIEKRSDTVLNTELQTDMSTNDIQKDTATVGATNEELLQDYDDIVVIPRNEKTSALRVNSQNCETSFGAVEAVGDDNVQGVEDMAGGKTQCEDKLEKIISGDNNSSVNCDKVHRDFSERSIDAHDVAENNKKPPTDPIDEKMFAISPKNTKKNKTDKKSDKKGRFFASPKSGFFSKFASPKTYSMEKPQDPVESGALALESDSESSSLRQDSNQSTDSASTISQRSYDFAKSPHKGDVAESPLTDTKRESSPGDVTLKERPRTAPPRPPRRPGEGPAPTPQSGIVLLSSRGLSDDDSNETGAVTLLSSTSLDHGYPASHTAHNNHHDGTVTSGGLPSEPEESGGSQIMYTFNPLPSSNDVSESVSHKRPNQYHSCPIVEWSEEQVCHWLMAIEMDQYIPQFREHKVSGGQLLVMDATKLKSIGVTSNADRAVLKRKIKEMKLAIEKEKKQSDKEKRIKEREEKRVVRKK